MVGVKLLGERTDVDLGLFLADFDDDDDHSPALPVISISRRY